MAKSKRALRRIIVLQLLKHLKSDYDVEPAADDVRRLFHSSSGIDAFLSFRSDSRLDELKGALERVESGVYGICVACKRPIARDNLDDDVTRRVCPSCETEINRRSAATSIHVPSAKAV